MKMNDVLGVMSNTANPSAGSVNTLVETSSDPQWYKDAVIYQLHVKSFFDSNNDGIGDFEGLIAKLDYIVELGVDTLWLLPFYPSPRRDDGYDIAQYRGVHPDYGKIADAKRFIAAAHQRGLRVITELVINHTSDQHPWFQRARRAKPGSNARNFYVWSSTNQTYSGTRIIFCDTETSNWTWDPEAGAYFWHRFYSHQPDLNFDNPAVLREVLGVMKFWLDIGVDGLRLDAVPYLVEREGTSNENLPETHAILKKIRAALDAQYHGRLLLAEANMWPEDVQQYFGGDVNGMGDECHMAFHFPLMPRMYMAIAREDRHPITDIIRQTPDIPSNCQWTIFLRNHDELTLEMVTSRERDYLWQTYASEQRARINLGIRRRLSPLMERDRRRIELMNSLLFSMPGTPVIYYGDEIGMGDNIHLGDRDGVRTPMQWSSDRNGGFSRADPETMVLPPIRSALYGFEAVNVETQAKDPHSLLNWTRRMLGLRRQHRAFGRGTIQFLSPGNRKILAYLREYEGETLLCVANLARTPQAVELDLGAFAGRVPVELMGGTAFPSIGQLTYLLTLPPHGFYWFELSTQAAPPEWHTVDAGAQELLTLVLHNRVGYELTATSRTALEREVLPGYLMRRRWFVNDNSRPVIRILHAAPVPGADEVFIAEVSVRNPSPASLDETSTLRAEPRYQIPVSILWDEEDSVGGLPQQLAMARVRRGPRVGLLTDAFSLERFARAVVRAMRAQARVPAGDGQLIFRGFDGLDDPRLDDAPIRWPSVEQSNSSLLLEGAAMLKVIRRVLPGIHPEVEMTRHLDQRGYRNTARLLGDVTLFDRDGEPTTMIVLQQAIPNEGDGWTWMLDTLKRTVDDAALIGQSQDDFGDQLVGVTTVAAAIGRRLAELHQVLALPDPDPAFDPRAAGAADGEAWVVESTARLERALARLAELPSADSATDTANTDKNRRDPLRESLRGDVDDLLRWRDDLLALPARLARAAPGAWLTRTHGDFHLGQVLVSGGDVYLIDFEGEPTRTLDERRALSSPIRDVAGLLRSIDYVVQTVHRDGIDRIPSTDLRDRRDALHERYLDVVTQAFLNAYIEVAEHASTRWVDDLRTSPLLDLFLLDKAAYEIDYEAGHRPGWISVPVHGLAKIARRLLGASVTNDSQENP